MKPGFRKPRAIATEVQLKASNPDAHGHPQNCLNCSAALIGSYCHVCGQSAHTHRMSFKHFLVHDVVHGIWHLDKGLAATLKKAFVNPGKEIRAYLAGKRVGWFSILTLVLLLYGIQMYVVSLFETTPYETSGSKAGEILVDFLSHNAKWMLLVLSFVCSLSSFLIFRRSKLNLSEHTIINCFFLVGMLALHILIYSIPFDSAFFEFAPPVAIAVYLVYGYYGAFRAHYSGWGFSWRIVVHGLLSLGIAFSLLLGGIKLVNLVTGEKKFRFEIEAKAPAPLKTNTTP